MKNLPRLTKNFFARPTVTVAKELLGKTLVMGKFKGIITETEAYCGLDDPASHAFRGITPRTAVMFGEAGHSYVYFIYGMYHCLNIVTETTGVAGAVLIRGLKLPDIHLDGPGKICRHLGITREQGGIHLASSDHFYVTETPDFPPFTYQATPRIGIKKATDKLWRFVMTKN